MTHINAKAIAPLVAALGLAAQGAAPALPQSTAIAAKLDLAKARSLPATSKAIDCLFAKIPELGKSEQLLSQAMGASARESLDSIVAAADGFAYDGESLTLSNPSTVAQGSFDAARIATTIRSSAGAKRAKAGDVEVLSSPLTRGLRFAFPAQGTVLASSTDAGIARLVASVTGKVTPAATPAAKALALDCPAVAVIDGSRGAANLSVLLGGLVKADADTIVAKVVEDTPGTAVLEVEMSFADDSTAAQAFASINGLKMITALQQARGGKSPAMLNRFIESDLTCKGSKVRMAVSATTADFASILK